MTGSVAKVLKVGLFFRRLLNREKSKLSRPTTSQRTSTGTTLMLLNGEPLISFVLTTVYTSTFFSKSTARWIWKVLKNSDAEAKAITSDFANFSGMVIGPTARQAIENLLGSSASPRPPFTPPVSARDI